MATQIYAALVLSGKNIEHSKLTRCIGLDPTKQWKENDQILTSKLTYKHDGWMLSTNKIETLDIQEPLEQLFEKLNPVLSKIKEVISLFNLEVEIQCIVYTEEPNSPALWFDKKIIKIISELNADLDIDYYNS